MKKVVLFFFLIFQLSMYAQDNAKWSIGFDFSIDDLSISGSRSGLDYIITDGGINGYSVNFNQFNYNLGFNTNYQINEKISLSSGILFSNKDFSGVYICPACGLTTSVTQNIKQRFLTIPISIYYSLSNGKLKPVVEVGFNNNITIKHDLETQSKNYFLEGFIGASLYYEFTESWQAGVGYNYQTALSDLYKTDGVNLRSNRFFLRINYSLK